MGGIRILLLITVSFFLHCLGRGGGLSILFVLMRREGGLDIHEGPLEGCGKWGEEGRENLL